MCGCRRVLARRLLFLAPPIMYCVLEGDELLKSREPIRPLSSFKRHRTNSWEKQSDERDWQPKPRVVMNLTGEEENEIEMKEVAGENMFRNKVSDPIPRKAEGRLELKINLTRKDLVERGGYVE